MTDKKLLQTISEKESLDSDRRTQIESFRSEYAGALRNYFRKRGAQDATCDDLVQDVFSRLLSRKVEEGIRNPRGYIMQTALSVWNDHLRKRQSRQQKHHVSYDDVLHSPEGFSPERVLEGKQAIEMAVEAIKKMPSRTRQVYLLCHVDGMRRKEVARRLGISVSAIDKHLMSAKKDLGKLFGDQK